VDERRQRRHEVGNARVVQRAVALQMVGQPEVVVGEVGDDVAASVPQSRRAVLVAVARRLRQVERAGARVAERRDRLGGAVRAAVADASTSRGERLWASALCTASSTVSRRLKVGITTENERCMVRAYATPRKSVADQLPT
jgi:hypothetical protein